MHIHTSTWSLDSQLTQLTRFSRVSDRAAGRKNRKKSKIIANTDGRQGQRQKERERDAYGVIILNFWYTLSKGPSCREGVAGGGGGGFSTQQGSDVVATLTGQYWWKQDLYDNGGYIFKFNEQEEPQVACKWTWTSLVTPSTPSPSPSSGAERRTLQKCRVTRLNDVLIRRT